MVGAGAVRRLEGLSARIAERLQRGIEIDETLREEFECALSDFRRAGGEIPSQVQAVEALMHTDPATAPTNLPL